MTVVAQVALQKRELFLMLATSTTECAPWTDLWYARKGDRARCFWTGATAFTPFFTGAIAFVNSREDRLRPTSLADIVLRGKTCATATVRLAGSRYGTTRVNATAPTSSSSEGADLTNRRRRRLYTCTGGVGGSFVRLLLRTLRVPGTATFVSLSITTPSGHN